MSRWTALPRPVVVVGGGIAGLTTALALAPLPTVVLTGGPLATQTSSAWAQGGIAAAVGPDDDPDLHAADTLAAGAGLCDVDAVRTVTAAGSDAIAWLTAHGVRFDRDDDGALRLGLEGAHGRHRIVHAGGDRTGAAVMHALAAVVRRRPDIRVLEGFGLVDIITTGARAAGVLLEGADGGRLAVLAPQVVLATGGIGACFERVQGVGRR